MAGGPYMNASAYPVLGRDGALAAAVEVLAGGRSLLLTGRAGDGLTSLARVVVGRHALDGAVIVTGLAGLRDLPLAALAVAGAVSAGRPEDDPVTQLRSGLRTLEVTAAARSGPLLMLVEGVGHLDPLSVSLLVRATMEGTTQLVIAAPLGVDLSPLHPLLSGSMVRTQVVAPLPDDVLRMLAPDDVGDVAVERALALADGSPLWFQACLSAGWADGGDPLPPALRDLADWHLSRLDGEVVRMLEMVALAGAAPVATLAAATSADAVTIARDGAFLRIDDDHALVRNPAHRARLLEHASLRRAELVTALRTAADATGATLPLLDTDDRPLDSAITNAMVTAAPREVLAALDGAGSLPDALVLARGRARLETFDVPGAMRDLAALLGAGTDPAVRAEAGMGLAIVQAHLLGDVEAARRTIHETAEGIDDVALAGMVRTRQVNIEVYGYGMPAMEAVIPDPRWIPIEDHPARLGVLKARAALHAGRPGDLTAGDLPELLDLLQRTAATAAERWEGLVPMMWNTLMREGFAPAMAIVTGELERARAQGDLTAIGTWLHSMASALTLGGHPQVALRTIRRALAALGTIDRFGLTPHLELLEARCLAHLGQLPEAVHRLDRMDDGRGPPNGYSASFAAGVQAEVRALGGDAAGACELLESALDHARRIGWPLVGWAQVMTSVNAEVPAAPELAGASADERFVHLTERVQTDDPVGAVEAMRSLAAIGWVGAAAACGRRRDWSSATPREQLAAQHVVHSCQAVALPGVDLFPGPASARQLEVAQRVAGSMSDGQIAAGLNLSRRTVSNHLFRLYEAADLTGREDLSTLLKPVEVWTP